MANGAKELRFDIVGNADKFGEAAKTAQRYINELQRAGFDRMTDGVFAGGVAGFASRTVDALFSVLRKVDEVIERAHRLNTSPGGVMQAQRYGQLVGARPESTDAAIQQARQMRADAIAGDDEVVKAFGRIGIAIDEIRDLKPDELFFRILKAARETQMTAERYFAFSRLLGPEFASQAMSVAMSPKASQIAEQSSQNAVDKWILSNVSNPAMLGLVDRTKKQVIESRVPFEPFSSFGLRQEEQTSFLAEQNRQRMNLVSRSQLTTEERINEVVAERLRLVRLIEEEQDPLKRQKFIANSLNVEAELAGLVTKRESELRSAPGKATTDPLRAIGADFSRFSPTLATNLAQRQVEELQRLRATTEAGLSRIAQMLAP